MAANCHQSALPDGRAHAASPAHRGSEPTSRPLASGAALLVGAVFGEIIVDQLDACRVGRSRRIGAVLLDGN